MSNTVTKRMLSAYFQDGPVMMFLTGLFRMAPENFHSSEEIEIDIIRSDEDVSIAIQDLSTGYRMNSEDLYTNKGFKPPIHKEAIPLNAFDLIKRMPGQNPFETPDFRANVITRMFRGMRKVDAKVRRAIELQASQVLQTGTVTLNDANGNAVYTIDYKPKAAHFPTVSTAWSGAGDPAADILALANVIRNNGLTDPDQLIFGETAFENFIKNDDIQKRFDNRRYEFGQLGIPQMRGNGGQFRGTVNIGNYNYECWTYGGRYKDPQTGNKIKFIADDKVIVRASSGRLDATFGAIPNIGRELGITGPALVPELPGRLSSPEGGIDLFTNVWASQDGEQLFGGVGSRPLLIPTAIDTYGCLDTEP